MVSSDAPAHLAIAFAAAAVFVLVHVFVGRLRFLAGTPRSRWLSIAGGVSVAYVFLQAMVRFTECLFVQQRVTVRCHFRRSWAVSRKPTPVRKRLAMLSPCFARQPPH